ncbi:hypothetical protein DLAC_02304 [Tieghemostelium lacteum]|uniref:Uncharacterized protein n=1 Tax=Tieghemostelium lacteum TaxID=361077 RepID=A0A152A531_TIELA|nr:hypothetical protein DLAC_02304 [Tieghemostelium lacteum]|eukprot:KYR01187.1 hypothetical protein DLAC_02304 [Tieghemostelium lacteum]
MVTEIYIINDNRDRIIKESMIALKEVVIIVIEHLQEIQIDIIIEMIIRLHLETIIVSKDTQELYVSL